MEKVSIVFFSLGVLLILSTFINIRKRKKVSYTSPKLNKFINKIKNSKFISYLVNEENESNKKLLNQIQVISQSKQAEELYKYKYRVASKAPKIAERKMKSPQELLRNVYLLKIVMFILVLVICLFAKNSLNSMVVKEILTDTNVHNVTNYKVSTSDASSILSYIGDDYKSYIKKQDKKGLEYAINEFVKGSKLNVDSEDISALCDIYEQAYEEGTIGVKGILIIVLLALVSTYLIKFYILVKYKVCNIKLLSEFYSMELIALLHMNRDELNVYEILVEVNKYAFYLKPYFTRCLNRYASNPVIALDKLIKEVDNENFTSFILILKSCLDKSKNINSEVLKIQRKLRFLNEKLDSDKSLEFKQLCLTIAQFPLILIFVLNLIMPFVKQLNLSTVM